MLDLVEIKSLSWRLRCPAVGWKWIGLPWWTPPAAQSNTYSSFARLLNAKGMKSFLFQGSCRFRRNQYRAAVGSIQASEGESVKYQGIRDVLGLKTLHPSPRSPRALFHCGQEETPAHTSNWNEQARLLWETPDVVCSAFAPSHVAQTHSQPSTGTYAYRNPVLLCLWVRPENSDKRGKGIIACCHPFIRQQNQFWKGTIQRHLVSRLLMPWMTSPSWTSSDQRLGETEPCHKDPHDATRAAVSCWVGSLKQRSGVQMSAPALRDVLTLGKNPLRACSLLLKKKKKVCDA